MKWGKMNDVEYQHEMTANYKKIPLCAARPLALQPDMTADLSALGCFGVSELHFRSSEDDFQFEFLQIKSV